MQPRFNEEKANDLIREFQSLTLQVSQLEKRLDKYSSVLKAVFELMSAELNLEQTALAEKVAAVLQEAMMSIKRFNPTCAAWRYGINRSSTLAAQLSQPGN
jgi:hypothetical protein